MADPESSIGSKRSKRSNSRSSSSNDDNPNGGGSSSNNNNSKSNSTNTTANQANPCTLCNRSYKRREHLHRHLLSHSASLPYTCAWCSSSFRRPDVLKRHAQKCMLKAMGGDAAASSTPSHRRRACDRCVRQKRGCSAGQPCDNCRRRSMPCVYSFAKDVSEWNDSDEQGTLVGSDSVDTSVVTSGLSNTMKEAVFPPVRMHGVDDSPFTFMGDYDSPSDMITRSYKFGNSNWLDFLNLSQPNGDVPSSGNNPISDQPEDYEFHFLNNFTSRTGLVESFNCGSLDQRSRCLAAYLQTEADIQIMHAMTSVYGLENELDPSSAVVASSFLAAPPQDPLIIQTHQILFRVREVVTVKPRNSSVTLEWSAALEQQCLQFFSPPNLARFISLYWSVWHPNVNLLHRASFDPADSKSILIAAMALTGACVSPLQADNEQAKPWLNCVEEMVFIDDDFCSSPVHVCDSIAFSHVANKWKIQALQASYMACVCQNWEGTDAGKRRIRRYRFSTVISVARDIGIASARHLDYSTIPSHELDWKDFVLREQLIRTVIWIFLLDQAFVIFNNLPPRMVINEMIMHMAWPESTFQAATGPDWTLEAESWMRRSRPFTYITFREVMERMVSGPMDVETQERFADFGPLNLFGVVSAFHTLLFQYQNSFGGEDQLKAFHFAIGNWKSIWEIYSSRFSRQPPHSMVGPDIASIDANDMWKRVGFMRHSPEFWLLASLVLNELEAAAEGRAWSAGVIGEGSGGEGVTRTDPILSKYDETNMRQVNDLITQFRRVNI